MTTKTQAPDPAQAPRPFTAVKAFADSVLAMLDERIKTADRGTHPFNDYFGDKPEAIVAAKAQASELREVRTQVRMLGDRALVDLMKFKPAIPAPEGAQADRERFEVYFAESRRNRGPSKRPTFEQFDDGTYKDDHTQRHWWTWQQARAALAAPAPHCTRSHPHEDMIAECEALTVKARADNAAARAAPAPQDSLDSAQPSNQVARQAAPVALTDEQEGVPLLLLSGGYYIKGRLIVEKSWAAEAGRVTEPYFIPAPQTKEPTNDR